LTNIDAGGFGSMAFHSYPDTLRWDAYSGDYGPNFLGHVLGAATYVIEHPVFGMVSFGGNLKEGRGNETMGKVVTVEPRDAVRQRAFVAMVGLWVVIDAGRIQRVEYNVVSGGVSVTVVGDEAGVSSGTYSGTASQKVVLQWEQTRNVTGKTIRLDSTGLTEGLGGYVLQVSAGGFVTVEFSVG
jgi:hypothetical protein